MIQLWVWLVTSKTAKVGGSILGGSSLVTVLISLFSAQIDDLEAKINAKDESVRNYVDAKHNSVNQKIDHLKEGQDDIKSMLIKIDERIYKLKTGAQ